MGKSPFLELKVNKNTCSMKIIDLFITTCVITEFKLRAGKINIKGNLVLLIDRDSQRMPKLSHSLRTRTFMFKIKAVQIT